MSFLVGREGLKFPHKRGYQLQSLSAQRELGTFRFCLTPGGPVRCLSITRDPGIHFDDLTADLRLGLTGSLPTRITVYNMAANIETKLLANVEDLSRLPLDLKRQANSCSPILTLPRELFREICTILAAIWPPSLLGCWSDIIRPDRNKEQHLGWITLSHVSHTLRSAMLEHCTLWAEIVCASPHRARDEFLRRSGNSPINVHYLSGICRHTTSFMELVTADLSRARTISIAAPGADSTSIGKFKVKPSMLLGKRFEHLVSLTISTFFTGRSSETAGEPIHESAPMWAPQLKSLKFRGFFVPFEPSTLTSLVLQDRNKVISLPSETLFDILRSAVSLEKLELLYWIPGTLVPSRVPTLSLTGLKSIKITDELECGVSFWSHLDLKADVERIIEVQRINVETAVSDDFPERFTTTFYHPKVSVVSGLSVCEDCYGDVTITLYAPNFEEREPLQEFFAKEQRRYLSQQDLRPTTQLTFRVGAYINELTFDVTRFFNQFPKTIDPLSIEHLEIVLAHYGQEVERPSDVAELDWTDSFRNRPLEAWLNAFAPLSRVRSLSLPYHSDSFLLSLQVENDDVCVL